MSDLLLGALFVAVTMTPTVMGRILRARSQKAALHGL
jgi:hypothetical protein